MSRKTRGFASIDDLLYALDMIRAYRTVEIAVDADGEEIVVPVPLTLDLLVRIEDALEKANAANSWFNFRKGRSTLTAFIEFAEPYLPESLDRARLQPAFFSIFFSLVREALTDSLNESTNSTPSTAGSPAPTEARAAEASR